MSEHCGCEADISYGNGFSDAAVIERKDCRFPALVAEVERLRAASARLQPTGVPAAVLADSMRDAAAAIKRTHSMIDYSKKERAQRDELVLHTVDLVARYLHDKLRAIGGHSIVSNFEYCDNSICTKLSAAIDPKLSER